PQQRRGGDQTDRGTHQDDAGAEHDRDQEKRGRDESGGPPHEPAADAAPRRPARRRPGFALRPPRRLAASTPPRRAPAATEPARAAAPLSPGAGILSASTRPPYRQP